MKQANIVTPYKISIEEVEDPTPKADELLMSISAAGICGSDVHIFKGENPGIKPPHISGHEFGGKVISCGSDVKGFTPGTKIVVNPVVNCGICYYCKNALEHLCNNQYVIGGHRDGAMKEMICIPAANALPLPDDFEMNLSPLIEPAAVAIHSSGKISNSTVLVLGLGTVGLLAVQVLKQQGNTVLATDINNSTLDIAKGLGADFVYNFSDPNIKEAIASFLGEKNIDYIVENVNIESTLSFSVDIIKKSGEIIIVGIPPANFEVNILRILFNELTISSSTLYLDSEFVQARNMVVDGIIDVSCCFSKAFPLAEAQQAFDYKLSNKNAVKVNLIND